MTTHGRSRKADDFQQQLEDCIRLLPGVRKALRECGADVIGWR